MLSFEHWESAPFPEDLLSGLDPVLVWSGGELLVYSPEFGGFSRFTLSGDSLIFVSYQEPADSDLFGTVTLEGSAFGTSALNTQIDRIIASSDASNDGHVFYSLPEPGDGYRLGEFTLTPLDHGGDTLFIGSWSNGRTLNLMQYDGDGQFTTLSTLTDNDDTYLDSVEAMASFTTSDGRSFVLTGSLSEHGVSSFELINGTTLEWRDSLGQAEGFGFNTVTTLEIIEVNGTTMVLAGSYQSGTISVLALSDDGELSLVDQAVGTRDNLFFQNTQLEAVQVDGHTLVIAGGDGGGLALFRLLPDGQLQHLETLDASTLPELGSFGSMNVQHIGDQLRIFFSSTRDATIAHVSVDLSDLGLAVEGSEGSDTLTGTADDDQIFGAGGNDTLDGGAGDDVIIGGAGSDEMTGGSGADLFVSDAGDDSDVILDFELGVDKIDLSAWGRQASFNEWLESLDQLTITSTADGAIISFEDHELVLITRDGESLSYDDFLETDAFGLFRPQTPTIPVAPEPLNLIGTPFADELIGTSLDDTITGLAGSDTLNGQAGNDTIDAGADADVASGHDGDDSIVGGAGMDTIYGGDGADTVVSNTARDTVYGGNGDDVISSNEGRDVIYGEAGNDELSGLTGADTIYGGTGDDTIVSGNQRDSLYGGNGDDEIRAGSARDTIFGESGDDTIYGEEGSDLIDAGFGDDVVQGGTGADTILSGAGNDTLEGSQGFDRLEGGAGDDILRGGSLADTFVFDRAHGNDVIEDFGVGSDVLALSFGLVGRNKTTQQVLEQYTRITDSGIIFDFGPNGSILLEGFDDLDALSSSMDFF